MLSRCPTKYGTFMQHRSNRMRRASVIDIAFGRHVRRRGLFARILGAHDASRRMGARQLISIET